MKDDAREQRKTVLVVGHDEGLRRCLRNNLRSLGYEVLSAADAEAALELFRSSTPDLVLTDVMLPRMDGFTFARMLRGESNVPILMLNVKTDDADVVRGLEAGADDYVTKPFDIRDLLNRANNLLIPAAAAPCTAQRVRQVGDVTVDLRRERVSVCGQDLSLTPSEYRLLVALACSRERVLDKSELLAAVWGPAFSGEFAYLDACVRRLCAKIQARYPDVKSPIRESGAGYALSCHGPGSP